MHVSQLLLFIILRCDELRLWKTIRIRAIDFMSCSPPADPDGAGDASLRAAVPARPEPQPEGLQRRAGGASRAQEALTARCASMVWVYVVIEGKVFNMYRVGFGPQPGCRGAGPHETGNIMVRYC